MSYPGDGSDAPGGPYGRPYQPEPYQPEPYQPEPYQPQPPYPPPPMMWGYPPGYRSPTTNGLAIASMVLGILWIYWIGSILAVVFGFVARSQIKQRGQDGDGMAIAGLVLGLIGVGTLLILIGFGAASGGAGFD